MQKISNKKYIKTKIFKNEKYKFVKISIEENLAKKQKMKKFCKKFQIKNLKNKNKNLKKLGRNFKKLKSKNMKKNSKNNEIENYFKD